MAEEKKFKYCSNCHMNYTGDSHTCRAENLAKQNGSGKDNKGGKGGKK